MNVNVRSSLDIKRVPLGRVHKHHRIIRLMVLPALVNERRRSGFFLLEVLQMAEDCGLGGDDHPELHLEVGCNENVSG